MASRDERAARTHFEERVIRAVWGANGYTTLAQADELHDHLALTSSSRLLDVGTMGCSGGRSTSSSVAEAGYPAEPLPPSHTHSSFPSGSAMRCQRVPCSSNALDDTRFAPSPSSRAAS